jgi:hypothetical protein
MRTYARLPAVVFDARRAVGSQAASATDNSADPDGLGGGSPADMKPFITSLFATSGGRAATLGSVDPFGFSWLAAVSL